MIKAFNLGGALLVLVLAGCASTVTRSGNSSLNIPAADTHKLVLQIKDNDELSKNEDWSQFRLEWNKEMAGIATVNGLDYTYQVAGQPPTTENGTLVAVTVNDYRYITATTRMLVGVMSGNAWLDVDVEYRDLANGSVLGTRNYQTKSTAWQGAFSAMTEKQIESVCNEIVGEIVKHVAKGVESKGQDSASSTQKEKSTIGSAAAGTQNAIPSESATSN